MINLFSIVFSLFFSLNSFANEITLEIKGSAYDFRKKEELSYVLEDRLDHVLKEVLSPKSCRHSDYEVQYKKVTEGSWPFSVTYYKYSTSINVNCPDFLKDIKVKFSRYSNDDYCDYVDFTVTLFDVSNNQKDYKSREYLCDF